jgi:hypothetical protein
LRRAAKARDTTIHDRTALKPLTGVKEVDMNRHHLWTPNMLEWIVIIGEAMKKVSRHHKMLGRSYS